MFKLGIIPTSAYLLFVSISASAIEYKPYTRADIDAKISCSVAISKAEFKIGKLGFLGTPKICHGVQASELEKWDCITEELDKKDINFNQALDICLP